jgi:hypothetical protein
LLSILPTVNYQSCSGEILFIEKGTQAIVTVNSDSRIEVEAGLIEGNTDILT